MSDIRLEALRLAVTLNSDSDKVVQTAEKFVTFLAAGTVPPVQTKPKVVEAETVKEPAKEPAAESPKTEAKVEEFPIKTRVAALAKALLNKSRPKLASTLKELGFEKASLITDEKLPDAEKAFTKAISEAA